MEKLPRRNFLHLASAVALPAVPGIVWARAYPTRPVRIIVGFAAGGGYDIDEHIKFTCDFKGMHHRRLA
jgi:hypothetical protein